MISLNLNQINRTAFSCDTKISWANHNCTYCKNDQTNVIHDSLSLKPFKEFYKEKIFKVLECSSCNAVWSLMKNYSDLSEEQKQSIGG